MNVELLEGILNAASVGHRPRTMALTALPRPLTRRLILCIGVILTLKRPEGRAPAKCQDGRALAGLRRHCEWQFRLQFGHLDAVRKFCVKRIGKDFVFQLTHPLHTGHAPVFSVKLQIVERCPIVFQEEISFLQVRLECLEDGGVWSANRRQPLDETFVAFDVIAGPANFRPQVEMELFEMRRDVPLNLLAGTHAEDIRRGEKAREC